MYLLWRRSKKFGASESGEWRMVKKVRADGDFDVVAIAILRAGETSKGSSIYRTRTYSTLSGRGRLIAICLAGLGY